MKPAAHNSDELMSIATGHSGCEASDLIRLRSSSKQASSVLRLCMRKTGVSDCIPQPPYSFCLLVLHLRTTRNPVSFGQPRLPLVSCYNRLTTDSTSTAHNSALRHLFASARRGLSYHIECPTLPLESGTKILPNSMSSSSFEKTPRSYVTGRPNCPESGSCRREVKNDVWKYLQTVVVGLYSIFEQKLAHPFPALSLTRAGRFHRPLRHQNPRNVTIIQDPPQ